MTTPRPTPAHQEPIRPTEAVSVAAIDAAAPRGPYLTEQQLADRWQVHPGSLANARGRGRELVPFIKLMGRVRYPLMLVEQYEQALLTTELAA